MEEFIKVNGKIIKKKESYGNSDKYEYGIYKNGNLLKEIKDI